MVPQRPTPGNDPLPQSVDLPVAAVDLQRGRASAVAATTIADALAELLGLAPDAWLGCGFERIKQRTVRSVYRGALGLVAVHVKVYRPDTFADRARDAMRGPRGQREADNLRAAAALGLPVVEPLAHGFVLDADRPCSFVVTRTVAGTPFTFAQPAAVQMRVGALLRTLHDRGLQPGDLHPGNLVVGDDGAPHLLDLTSVQHVDHPDLTVRARSLAFFCQALDAGALDPAAAALLHGYVSTGVLLPATFAEQLVLATRRWRAAALPAFGRRSTRNCRHTEVPTRRRGVPRWFFHLDADEAAAALRAQCAAFVEAPPTPRKSGRRGAVWLHDDLAVKQREAGAAQRLWRAAYWLQFAKVPIAPPIALRLHGGRGHMFSRRLGDTLATELANGRLDAAALQQTARALGDHVGRLHAHGLGNRDLKLDNLVRTACGDIAMVDLDGVRRRAATETRGRGADLGRLLAAFRGAGSPGGERSLRTFLRSYLRTHARLLQDPPLRRILRRAEQRAGEWASAHR